MTRDTCELLSDVALERAAHALWSERNPSTPLDSLDEYEREGAWANTLADCEVVIRAALGESER